jgi:hypothetical protein
VRRVAAVIVALALMALVAADLWDGSVRAWWDRHSLTGSVVSNLLVLAVTALIVDEVVAHRQRRERAVSVAVQGLIVYGQAQRAYNAVTDAVGSEAEANGPDELRTLASMLLTASPSLFDDPEARQFLEQVERFSVSMFRAVTLSAGKGSGSDVQALAAEKARLETAMRPLLERIPAPDRGLLEGATDG